MIICIRIVFLAVLDPFLELWPAWSVIDSNEIKIRADGDLVPYRFSLSDLTYLTFRVSNKVSNTSTKCSYQDAKCLQPNVRYIYNFALVLYVDIYFSNVLICVFLFLLRIYRSKIWDKVSLALKEQLRFLWEFRVRIGKPHLHITSQRLQKLYKHNNHNLGDQFHCCYLCPADPLSCYPKRMEGV